MTSKDDILSANALPFNGLSINPESRRERLFPPCDDSSEISVACFRGDYAASRIARAVEDCDAHLLNLNITADTTDDGKIIIDMRISHRDATAVSRSLERYGYDVVRTSANASTDNAIAMERIGELLARLNV